MKKSVFISILLLTGFICFSCMENTDDLFQGMYLEISPDTKSQVIKKELEGIIFEFCLLNEQGQPATVFKEGENFSFNFSATNTSGKDLYFHLRGDVLFDNDFFRVYHSSGADLGRSFEQGNYTAIGIAAYPFNTGEIRTIKVPWLHEGNSISCGGGIGYYSIFKEPLAKGKYYTNFKSSFYFVDQQSGNWTRTDSAYFKINFHVQ